MRLAGKATGEPSGGSQTMLSASVTLTNAQIKALPTTAVNIVAPVGAGFAPVLFAAYVRLDLSGGAYTNCQIYDDGGCLLNVGLTQHKQIGENLNDGYPLFVNGATDSLDGYLTPLAKGSGGGFIDAWGQFENAPLCVSLVNGELGNLTGGHADNSMLVTVYYALVTL